MEAYRRYSFAMRGPSRGMNDQRPIFHVGLHKTGTTWFQKKFYPRVSGYRFIPRELVRVTLLAESPLAFDAAEARKRLQIDGDEPAIVCEEDLSGVLHNGLLSLYAAKEMANQIAAIAPEARIVLFVRSQTSLAASSYHQYLREGGTGSVHAYLFPEDYHHPGDVRPLKVPRFDFRQFEFDRLVAHYDTLFGRENVFVFALEQFRKEPEQFLDDFCAKLGIDRPPDVANERLNPSFRRGLLPVVRAMNRFTRRSVIDKSAIVHIPYWYQRRKKLLKWANRRSVFGSPPTAEKLLGTRTFQWIQRRFRESNLALERRMAIDLHALGYFGEDGDEIQRPERARLLQRLKN